jgi:hypothetical protein
MKIKQNTLFISLLLAINIEYSHFIFALVDKNCNGIPAEQEGECIDITRYPICYYDGSTIKRSCDDYVALPGEPGKCGVLAIDIDDDGIGNSCDNCPHLYNPDQFDIDKDGIGDHCDNCPYIYNPNQKATIIPTIGDVCVPGGQGGVSWNGCSNQISQSHFLYKKQILFFIGVFFLGILGCYLVRQKIKKSQK